MRIEPPAIIATPATLLSELRGCRVIVGIPGIGFRPDLRADDAVTNGGRTFVPVLTEQDYYRAELEQIEVFAPLVPIDRVWVEHVSLDTKTSGHSTRPLDSPSAKLPVPASSMRSILGLRVVQAVPDGFLRDLRAVTDAYNNGRDVTVRICDEAEWYRWALTGASPSTIEVRSDDLWIE